MAYAGNRATCNIVAVIPNAKFVSGKAIAGSRTIEGDLEYSSDYYSNRIQKACENFYKYQNVTKAVKTSYYFKSIYVEYMGKKVRYEVPMPNKIFV